MLGSSGGWHNRLNNNGRSRLENYCRTHRRHVEILSTINNQPIQMLPRNASSFGRADFTEAREESKVLWQKLSFVPFAFLVPFCLSALVSIKRSALNPAKLPIRRSSQERRRIIPQLSTAAMLYASAQLVVASKPPSTTCPP